MDLFDDLPEPEKLRPSTPEAPGWGAPEVDVFADLPPPKGENRGTKRKAQEGEDEAPDPPRGCVKLRGFCAQKRGEREEMQDRHVLLEDFHTLIPNLHPSVSRVSYFAVFDGHGGARASDFAAENLHRHLAQRFPHGPLSRIEKEMGRALVEAFRRTDEEFLVLASRGRPRWKDGTTALVLLAVEDALFVANLGDSKAVLCRWDEESKRHLPLPLSVDHTPTDYRERMRIQKAGGYVREGRVMGAIEVSRSLGDAPFKGVGVSSVPDVRLLRPSARDPFLLMACDGLWKVLGSQEALQLVLPDTKEDAPEEICWESACGRLASEAVRKCSGDNVTVLLVAINKIR
ncbi:integrin-linked kinase-associated serine/threonine phosphatase 2C-like [Uloborus diversus]|uniref:integrin-linked kinase-associated serine/threonine phosphatase 2C-like n=1 Tax=Uloborus diversus TaxID=327109 RepID=UPI00240986F0|nr:integrin-linked kinase-associated serine/threonine phosphatase 2C-like [Uloborus diversus]